MALMAGAQGGPSSTCARVESISFFATTFSNSQRARSGPRRCTHLAAAAHCSLFRQYGCQVSQLQWTARKHFVLLRRRHRFHRHRRQRQTSRTPCALCSQTPMQVAQWAAASPHLRVSPLCGGRTLLPQLCSRQYVPPALQPSHREPPAAAALPSCRGSTLGRRAPCCTWQRQRGTGTLCTSCWARQACGPTPQMHAPLSRVRRRSCGRQHRRRLGSRPRAAWCNSCWMRVPA